MKCNILNTFAFKNYGKFDERYLEKLYHWSLASTIPVLGLERVCPRKVGPWPWIFFLSPWPRTLCPRLHLCPTQHGSVLLEVLPNSYLIVQSTELVKNFEGRGGHVTAQVGVGGPLPLQVRLAKHNLSPSPTAM